MFGSCSALGKFWNSIFEAFSYVCNKIIDPNLITAVFGVLPNQHDITSYHANAVDISFGPKVEILEIERCAATFFYSVGERSDDVFTDGELKI